MDEKEVKTINAEAEVTDIQVIEPQILSADLNVTTNFEEVKQNLKAITEKYVGLVVTDQNQKDMEKTLREVVSLRTNIQKFEVNGKRQLRRPIDQFANACKELLKIVNEAERPLREQLDAYEAKRQEGVTKAIEHKYRKKSDELGVRDEFRHLEILAKWMNKTAKWTETCSDIDRMAMEHLSAQKQHDDLKELRNSRRELALLQIEKSNRDYALATPITEDFLTDELLDTSAEIIKNTINEEALRRHEMDENARQVSSPAVSAPPPAAKPPVVPIPQVEPGVSWPKVMTVTITLNSSFDYQAVENVLSSLPPQIRWNSDIKEI